MLDDLHAIDLNLLVVFAALMHERNVSRCAQRLHVGQPTISSSLGRLRILFQDPLFVRARYGVQPTAKAVEISHLIGQALDLIHASIEGANHFVPTTCQERFHIAVSSGVATSLITSVLNGVIAEAPQAIVSLEHQEVGSFGLDRASLSLAVGYFPAKIKGYARETLVPCRSVMVRATNSAAILSAADLSRRAHVIVPFGNGAETQIDEKLLQMGCSRNSVVRLPRPDGIDRLVLGTDTVAIMSSIDCHLLEHIDGLVFEPLLPELEDTFDFAMIWPEGKNLQPAEVWFREQVKRQLVHHAKPLARPLN